MKEAVLVDLVPLDREREVQRHGRDDDEGCAGVDELGDPCDGRILRDELGQGDELSGSAKYVKTATYY